MPQLPEISRGQSFDRAQEPLFPEVEWHVQTTPAPTAIEGGPQFFVGGERYAGPGMIVYGLPPGTSNETTNVRKRNFLQRNWKKMVGGTVLAGTVAAGGYLVFLREIPVETCKPSSLMWPGTTDRIEFCVPRDGVLQDDEGRVGARILVDMDGANPDATVGDYVSANSGLSEEDRNIRMADGAAVLYLLALGNEQGKAGCQEDLTRLTNRVRENADYHERTTGVNPASADQISSAAGIAFFTVVEVSGSNETRVMEIKC